ncbi:MAG: SH3 domain-containing protein [Gemmatimonadetes bacterium]|nr:SH3 domain-containing protein [Gemmatimonadota bacterium]
MALIKCPHCGHSVLSVASICPTCNATLGMTFLGPEHSGELTECRACGHTVRSASRVCPSCGVTAPGKRPAVLRVSLGVAALLLIGVFVVDRLPDSSPTDTVALAAPPSRKAPVRRPLPDSAPAAETVLIVPPAVRPDSQPLVLKTKWTTLWVNVRQGPADDAPIIKVLRPGTRVEAQARRYGWWLVFVDGDSLGYVAGDLLSAREPQQSVSTR